MRLDLQRISKLANNSEPEDITVDLRLFGPKEQIDTLLEVLGLTAYLCDIGSSRTIELDVDGDGPGAVKVQKKVDGEFTDLDVSEESGEKISKQDDLTFSIC